jgi:hypothetical protein
MVPFICKSAADSCDKFRNLITVHQGKEPLAYKIGFCREADHLYIVLVADQALEKLPEELADTIAERVPYITNLAFNKTVIETFSSQAPTELLAQKIYKPCLAAIIAIRRQTGNLLEYQDRDMTMHDQGGIVFTHPFLICLKRKNINVVSRDTNFYTQPFIQALLKRKSDPEAQEAIKNLKAEYLLRDFDIAFEINPEEEERCRRTLHPTSIQTPTPEPKKKICLVQ